MVTLEQAFHRSLDRAPVVATTGIPFLDFAVGGLCGGDVWVVTSEPRTGRTTFACQVAGRAAAGLSVHVFAGVEGPEIAIPLTSSIAGVSRYVAAGRSEARVSEKERVDRSMAGDVSVHLQVDVDLRAWLSHGPRSLVIVDDLDLWTDDLVDAVQLVKSWALTTGGAAVVTVPEDLVVAIGSDRQAWVRAVDVQIGLRVPGDAGLGGAEVLVEHHRRGPLVRVVTRYEPARTRFAPFPDDRMPDRMPESEVRRLMEEPGWDPEPESTREHT